MISFAKQWIYTLLVSLPLVTLGACSGEQTNDVASSTSTENVDTSQLSMAEMARIDAETPKIVFHPDYEKGMQLLQQGKSQDGLALLEALATVDDRFAQYQVGLLYARGDVVKQDFQMAKQWLEKSAYQGHPQAQYWLGRMYEAGDLGEVDEENAATWYWVSKQLGDKYAKKRMRALGVRIDADALVRSQKRANEILHQIPHDLSAISRTLH